MLGEGVATALTELAAPAATPPLPAAVPLFAARLLAALRAESTGGADMVPWVGRVEALAMAARVEQLRAARAGCGAAVRVERERWQGAVRQFHERLADLPDKCGL